MRLTVHSDYGLRVLIFLAAKGGAAATIPEIAGAYDISRAHLMKVVNELGRLGYVATTRGRKGGIVLARAPAAIRIGEVVRQTEENLALVECFSKEKGAGCRIDGACRLKGALAQALGAFLDVLDGYTLEDIVKGRSAPLLRRLRIA
ncbi:MAG TPA: Rrf2 family transcriptional regulator [Polyangiaceae bacterium]|nr:Rrf2 family transcriptional regulator [Polyangiaceae bacterium]